MKTIIIDDVFEFDKIGEGAEGEVFKIDDDTVYKYLKHRKTREDKIKKIKYLKNIDLEKFVQIKDIVSDGYVEIGYTMKLVKTNSFINVKKALNDEISLNEKIEYIKDIENTIKEAHNKGIVLVDMFYHNFLINENNKVIGIDIDNWSVECAKNNCKLNNVDNFEILLGDSMLLNNLNQQFDIIFANINRNIILSDMERYVKVLKNGGDIYFSGFYSTDLAVIISAANKNNLELEEKKEDNNWIAVKFKKKVI